MSDAGEKRKDRRDNFLLWLSKQKSITRDDGVRYLQIWTGLKPATLKGYWLEWCSVGFIEVTKQGRYRASRLTKQYLRQTGQAL